MGETMQVVRDGRVLLGATDLVHSPDDGGYYFSQADFQKGRRRKMMPPLRFIVLGVTLATIMVWGPWFFGLCLVATSPH